MGLSRKNAYLHLIWEHFSCMALDESFNLFSPLQNRESNSDTRCCSKGWSKIMGVLGVGPLNVIGAA